ncbi:MAG: hypothetical protein AAGG68_22875 [Bacteroidota bacterium]
MKNIVVILLSLPVLVSVGGLAKYQVQLNNFVEQGSGEIIAINKQSAIEKTEVYVIGGVYFETDSIKRHHLYEYLERISPSVILYESDSSTVRRIVKKTDYFVQLIDAFKGSNRVEKPVVLKYLKHHPNCILLPYEWELRSKYHHKHDLRKRSKEMLRSVIRLHLDSVLTKEQSTVIAEFLELNDRLIQIGMEH